MKKLTLFLVATLFSALSFAALNPYAYGLTSTLSNDQKTLTVNYSLNAPATSVVWKLMDGDKVIKTMDLSAKGLAQGSYTAVIPTIDFPIGKDLTWKIDVTGTSVSTPTKIDKVFNFFLPYGMDVDVDPESDYLGNWYVIEATNGAKGSSTRTGYQSYDLGRGLYAFDAALNPKKNSSGTYGFNNYTNLGATETNINSDYVNFYRVATSGGRVFIGKFRDGHASIIEANPANLNNAFTDVLKDGKRAISIDARGSGNNLKLVMLGTDYKMYEFDLGTSSNITTHSRTLNKSGLTVARDDASIAYDNEGGVWFNQNRGEANELQPTIAHVSDNGVDYNNVKAGLSHLNTNNSGIAVSPDGKQLAVVGAGQRTLTIYTISKDANGAISLAKKHTIYHASNIGKNHTALAWDYAGNLYVANRSAETITFYAMPYSGTVSTPCPSKYKINLTDAAGDSGLNPYAYDLSSTFNSANKKLSVNYTLNANATSVDIVIMDGDMLLKRVSCSGKTRGSHTEKISTEGLPMNRKFTWKVEVKGTSKSNPTKVSTVYSLWGPYGLAIDTDPYSDYFGRIIATESRHNASPSDANTDYVSLGTNGKITAGLYVFNPAFGTDRTVITGGLDFTRNATLNKGFQPFRIRISDDGRIFVTSLDINGVAVWEVSKDLKTWTPLLSGTNNSSNYLIYNGSTFFAGPNASIDVTGIGDDLKLLLYSVDKDGIAAAAPKGYRLEEYTMSGVETGEAFPTTGTHKAIKEFNGYNVTLNDANTKRYKYGCAYNQSVVIYDGEGGYWFAGSRGNNISTEPNLAHVSASGAQDYYNTSDQLLGGAGLLIHEHSTKGKILIKGTKPAGTFKIYSLSKNTDGSPKLTEIWTVTSGIGTNHNAFAVDYAENLYVVGNTSEKIAAFALPYSGMVSTPAKEEYAFIIYAGYTPASTDKLNPFAYGLSSELINGGMDLKVNYSLNSQANSAKVVIMQGNTEVKTVDCTNLAKGSYSMVIPTEGLPTGVDLTWKMVVNGTSVTKVEEYSKNYDVYHPSAIEIDNNPENATFGLVLTTEGLNEVQNQTAKNYLGKGYGSGIFAFNAAFDYVDKFNGGNTFTNARADNSGAKAYAPRRIRISDDGRIFVTSLNTNGDVLWEVNPENMNEWTPIFQGLTQDPNKDLVSGSTFVAGPNAGFDVRGSGENLQLLMLSANTLSYSSGQTGFRVSEYNLGNKKVWNSAPSKVFPHENFYRAGANRSYFIAATGSQVQYDKDGGVWYIQNRGACTETLPGLVYFDKNGVEKCKLLYNAIENAAFRFNHDFTKVAIADNKFVNIYSVEKDANGVPVLKQEMGFSLATVGRYINDFAWDYANNFYAAGYSSEKIVAYRLPYDGEVTTPAASKYTFRVEYEVTVDENTDNTTALTSFEGKTVTAKVVRNFTNNNYMTLTLPFDMSNAQVNQAFGSGNATIYTFASTQKDAEGTLELHFNTITSIQAGHPYILKLKNAVNGFEVDGVTISTALTNNEKDGITMQPVLDAGGILSGATQYWLASDNYLYHAQTYSTAILGLRAIFDIPAGSRVRARAVFNSNETTDVVDLTPDQTTTPTVKKVLHKGQLIIIRGEEKYTIQGQRME